MQKTPNTIIMEENKAINTREKHNKSTNMIKEDSSNCGSLMTLTLAEVGSIIKIKDTEAIKRWLKNNDIGIHNFSKILYVYQIEVDCWIDKNYVKKLKTKFPLTWKDLYKTVAKDDTVYKMVIFQVDGTTSFTPVTKVKRKSKSDDKLFEKLLK